MDDGLLAALARLAVDQLGPDIDIRIDPIESTDPYRYGAHAGWTVWPLIDEHRSFGVRVEADWSARDTMSALLDALSENSSESARFWGVAFPRCPGHAHAARLDWPDDPPERVVLSCPLDGSVLDTLVLPE